MCIALQGQSPLSYTMEGWAGPEKAEGWVTAWSSPLELPQPSPCRCCCCRHPVSISHPAHLSAHLQQHFALPHAGLHQQGRGGSARGAGAPLLGWFGLLLRRGSQEQGHPKLPVPPAQNPFMGWGCSPQPGAWPGEKAGPAAWESASSTDLALNGIPSPVSSRWVDGHSAEVTLCPQGLSRVLGHSLGSFYCWAEELSCKDRKVPFLQSSVGLCLIH